jgi:hypothetical protein
MPWLAEKLHADMYLQITDIISRGRLIIMPVCFD